MDRERARLEEAEGQLSSLIYNIDSRILSRRDLRSKLNNAVRELNDLEMQLRRLKNFNDNAMDGYCAADNHANKLALNFIRPQKKSFLDEIKVGVGVVVKKAKSAGSVVKKAFEPGGSLYKPFQVGKAIGNIVLGTVIVIASVAEIVGTVGAASPLAIIEAIYGVNSIANGIRDLTYAGKGNYEKMGTKNYLKDGLLSSGTFFDTHLNTGNTFQSVSKGAYFTGDVLSGARGLISAGAKIKNWKYAREVLDLKLIKPLLIDYGKNLIVTDYKAIKKVNITNLYNMAKRDYYIMEPLAKEAFKTINGSLPASSTKVFFKAKGYLQQFNETIQGNKNESYDLTRRGVSAASE